MLAWHTRHVTTLEHPERVLGDQITQGAPYAIDIGRVQSNHQLYRFAMAKMFSPTSVGLLRHAWEDILRRKLSSPQSHSSGAYITSGNVMQGIQEATDAGALLRIAAS